MSEKDSTYDCLKLENQLCFPLYVAAKEVVRRYKPFLDEIDLTYTQYITLMVLWEHKSMGVKAMGQYLYLDSGTLTPVLKTLEKKGLVLRKRDQADERNLIVTLTQKGEDLKEKAKEVPGKIGSCLSIGEEDAKELYKYLYKLLGSFAEEAK